MNLFKVPDKLIVRRESCKSILPEYRSEFMRDRDRILYATAFRRLAGKTQIYTVGLDDHKRNRLTHTLEVAQIARTIAQGLDLDSDLAEAIALAHDFGHTPFGHAGERMLNDIMVPESNFVKRSPFYGQKHESIVAQFERENVKNKDYYKYAFGFKHNLQSARVAAVLEDSYLGVNGENIGLNLTNFSLYGMIIHSKLKYNKADLYPNFHNELDRLFKLKDCDVYAWSFEAFVVSWADEIAQWHHDLEDAMRGGALPIERICKTIHNSLDVCLNEDDSIVLKSISESKKIDRKTIADLSHIVVNTLVDSLIENSKANFKKIKNELEKKGINDSETIFKNYDGLGLSLSKESIISIQGDILSKEFEEIIKGSVHHSRNVERMNEKGKYIIRKLFEAYYAHPQQLPDGPILHLLVDVGEFATVDEAKDKGVGEARVRFNKIMENPNIHIKCVLMRRICDHIASMTDHYAIDEYNHLYG